VNIHELQKVIGLSRYPRTDLMKLCDVIISQQKQIDGLRNQLEDHLEYYRENERNKD
jgi:hypothetical protein